MNFLLNDATKINTLKYQLSKIEINTYKINELLIFIESVKLNNSICKLTINDNVIQYIQFIFNNIPHNNPIFYLNEEQLDKLIDDLSLNDMKILYTLLIKR